VRGKLAVPGGLRGADFGVFSGLLEQTDQRLHVVVVFGGFQDQLYAHSKAWVHGLHYSLNPQSHIVCAHNNFDTSARG
jgi:hypothetical protein